MASVDIAKLCKLSRIDLTEEQKKQFSSQINEIISMFDELDSINTKGVKPSFHIFDVKNKYREDKIYEFKEMGLLKENIKFSKNKYITGPKLFE
ncbi:MAG: hypothetical protein DRN66_01605 [Candidatus Nanohalarchaeota archaeon]|nr:MAG: hypothetical protein DRN66_01605 [Candidatus Nanohaloarchaeota archaeon]